MFSENHPEQKQVFHSSAKYDINLEKLFSDTSGGFFLDSHNMQPTSNSGDTGAIEKIKGEEILYTNTRNDTGYRCVFSCSVHGKIVEVWAPSNPAFPGIIRVNGVVVLSSVDFELDYNINLQGDATDAVDHGEFTITDDIVPPYIFNVKDLQDSLISDPSKYFTAFDPKAYQINIQSALDIPVFWEMVNVGGGGGLPVGNYQYQMRYSSESGDRTNWSHPTPMIPIMESLSSDSREYPWVRTFGGAPNPSSPTSFAPKLKFRVTNLYDYEFIEIKRIPYNAGAGIEFTSNGTIVAKIGVAPGEISVREYIDPSDSNTDIALSAADEDRQLAHVKSAKSARFFSNKLVLQNVTLSSKELDLTFEEIDGQQGFPVIDKLYKAGHNDPWNHVYRKQYTHGEKFGFAVNVYDCVGNKGYAQKFDQLKNYQFPNRRDVISAETATYSFNGTVKAAATETGFVGQTHEVFDLLNRVYKPNNCDFKNIVEKGRIAGFTGTKTKTKINEECHESDAAIENHGAHVSGAGLVSVSYQPFSPVSKNDPDCRGHNYVVNPRVAIQDIILGGFAEDGNPKIKDYRPAGFAPDYYAMGMMIAGVDNFPDWAKAFSVVRTKPAGRVVCQGIGYYSLVNGEFKLIGNNSLGGKDSNRLWFYSPDIDHGIVSSETVNDMAANPSNYKMQFVSPLGFFSEWYGAESNLFANQRDRLVDMISYVRMLRDSDTSPEINPSESGNMGITGGDGYNYVAYDRYRNTTNTTTFFTGDPDGGNRLYNLNGIVRNSEGRGNFLNIELGSPVYGVTGTGGNAHANFDDDGLKNFTEPIYIVNIIRTGADVKDSDQQPYQQTTHYQKIESIIGKSTGLADQEFNLIDERWEDCIVANYTGANADRYIYIKLTNGEVKKWINVSYKTAFQKANIQADITAGIGDITGMYTHRDLEGNGRHFSIVFDQVGFYPPLDSLILVRYDKTAPIRVYGGDSFLGEAIFAPVDRAASAKEEAGEELLALGIGLPYKYFKINPRYYTVRKAGASLNTVQDSDYFSLGFIRQLCVMFTCESRACIHLAHNLDAPREYFPLTNYVIRPNRWEYEKTITDMSIYDAYVNDYGNDELGMWKWGGFRFLQTINPDYSCEPPAAFFSKPEFGFVEQLHYPTRAMWSLTRGINVQNAPGLKTFPANNSFDIDDKQGEIKFGWDDTTGRGENLYAFTESGICLLVTKKSILSDLGAGELGYMSADSFIGAQFWISKKVGMNDQLYRTAVEADVSISQENGNEVTAKALFFMSNKSAYRFMNNEVVDIRADYHSRLYPNLIQQIQPGFETRLSAAYDFYKKQYYVTIQGEGLDVTFVYSQKNGGWIGTNSFLFDSYTCIDNKMYGHRDMETYELNQGYQINGEPIEAMLFAGSAPESDKDKEFIRVRINSSAKPTRVDFYKTKAGVIQCSLDPSMGPYYLKNYRGYENYIGRIKSSVNSERPLFQGRLILLKIFHNLAEEFKIIDTTIQYKKIK